MADLASLVIGLRADVAQLQSDLGKANALNQRYAKSASDTWTSAGADIGKALGAGIIAIAGIGAAMAKQAIDAADGLSKLSQKVGVSVESLSALNVAAKLSDVSVDQLQGGLSRLARSAADAATGSKQQAAAFQAMGVSLKDTNGNLRSTESILGDVAHKFSQYEDSASKTALAQELFGKSGADLIPLLNQLGTEGFAKAREEAERYGAVISTEVAQQSEAFNDNLTRLKLETQGFANALTAELLPGLIKITDGMVDAGSASNGYRDSASALANAIKGVVAGLLIAKEYLTSVATVTFAFYDAVATTFTAAGKVVAAWAVGVYEEVKAAFSLDGEALSAARKSLSDNLSAIGTDVRTKFTAIGAALSQGVGENVSNVSKILSDLFGEFSNVSAGAETTANAIDKVNAPLVANADAANAAAKALADYNSAQMAAGAFIAKLQGGLDPLNKAYQDYVQTVLQANKISQQLIDTGNKAGKSTEAYAQAQAFMAKAVGLANVSLDEQVAKLARQGDVLGSIQQEYADQSALALMTDRQRAIAEAVQNATEKWTSNADALFQNKQTLDEVQKGAAAAAASTYDLTEAAKQSRSVAQEFTSIWTNAGNSIADAFSKWVVEGGSLMKSLTDIAKQVVEQIIAYFAKLAIINPILNAIFGGSMTAGGGGLLPVLGSVGGAVLGGGSLIGGGTSAAGNADLFGTASGGFSLFTAGKNIWNGFQAGWQSFFSSSDAFTMGPPTAAGSTSSYYGGGYTSGFGQALGIAGGIYAGYNRFQNRYDTGSGLAAGAAYGYGTYAAGAGIATAAATGSLAAGFAAIPVVGWIAIAAMLIDKFSGGKLFGTDANKLAGGGETIGISGSGADVTSHYTLKGQKPLFGGSYYEEHAYTDQDAIDAANQFFAQLKSGTEDFAKQFGVTMGDIVGGTFATTFDKHGNITSSSSTVNGVTYDNDTVQQFQERIVAENELAILGQFDEKLSDAIDKYRKNADDLYAITNDLAAAQMGFNQGLTFLALGSDQSTSALLHLAETSQHFGETVDQTLQRLMAAQAQYDQFVGQFKPATNYVDDFEATLSQINQQMQANVKQANALAQAAGAAGASEQDLANIHKYAAEQAQQAFRALQASAQSLAFGLGLTTVGSLDQVNAEIERLQAKANAGAGAVNNFGQAMQTAAENAKHAMDLLLGDLSPLNDQQKLQQALSGLRAGTVTQDQVLEIGRRLYSSTAQYTALFNMVQAMGSGAATSLGGAGFSGGNAGGLSAAESHRLQDLLKQQQQLQAAAQLQQYQTLAQQIAEISAFKGEDWHQVAKEMGIDIAAFEKGLGLTEKQTDDYITAIEKQTDDNGENTASIVAILTKIYDVLSGTDPNADPDAPNGRTPGRGGGHSGHGARNVTDEDADAIGRAVGRHSGHAGNPRSSRPPTAAATTR
jgi:TP901 family phage tail tape measure protein